MCYGIQCMIENANKAVLKAQEAKFKAERKAELKSQQRNLVKSLYDAKLPTPQMADIYANAYHCAPSTAEKHVHRILKDLRAEQSI